MRVCVFHGILRKCDSYFKKHHLDRFPCLICKRKGGEKLQKSVTRAELVIENPNKEAIDKAVMEGYAVCIFHGNCGNNFAILSR